MIALIDPRSGSLRGVPREVRDLTAAARNSWIVCFDNLSSLPDELADAACRLSTGGGFGGRELYSDHDEAIFDATRPLVLNAIPDLGGARPDFLDRSLIVEFLDLKPVAGWDRGRGSYPAAFSAAACDADGWRCWAWKRTGGSQ